MIVPTFQHTKVIEEDGNYSQAHRDNFDLLFSQMQKNLSDNGFVVPSQPTTTIAKLVGQPSGTLIYDSTTNQLKVLKNGIWVVII